MVVGGKTSFQSMWGQGQDKVIPKLVITVKEKSQVQDNKIQMIAYGDMKFEDSL